MLMFDPLYFLFLAPAILVGLFAQMWVKNSFHRAAEMRAASGISGAEVAQMILQSHDIHDVRIEPVPGFMSDHYDPRHKTLRLSPQVYQGRSVAALGIAAHEAGHAIQDASGYAPLKLRNGIVPLAAVGGNLSWILIMIGLLLGGGSAMAAGQDAGGIAGLLLWAGIILFSFTVVFQLINLPVEFNASKRAKDLLQSTNIVSAGGEAQAMNRVLNAAALTYVAATLTAILTLVYFLVRSGVLGGQRG